MAFLAVGNKKIQNKYLFEMSQIYLYFIIIYKNMYFLPGWVEKYVPRKRQPSGGFGSGRLKPAFPASAARTLSQRDSIKEFP
jgi:hypothetical protein